MFVAQKSAVIPIDLLYQCQTSPQYYILSTTRLTVQPNELCTFNISFLPDQINKQRFYIAKLILQTSQNTYQIPLLGVAGAPKLIQTQNSILNCGSQPIYVISSLGQQVLAPRQALSLYSTQQIRYANNSFAELLCDQSQTRQLLSILKLKSDVKQLMPQWTYTLQFNYQQPQACSLIFDVGEPSAEVKANQELLVTGQLQVQDRSIAQQVPMSTIEQNTTTRQTLNQNQSVDVLRQEQAQRERNMLQQHQFYQGQYQLQPQGAFNQGSQSMDLSQSSVAVLPMPTQTFVVQQNPQSSYCNQQDFCRQNYSGVSSDFAVSGQPQNVLNRNLVPPKPANPLTAYRSEIVKSGKSNAHQSVEIQSKALQQSIDSVRTAVQFPLSPTDVKQETLVQNQGISVQISQQDPLQLIVNQYMAGQQPVQSGNLDQMNKQQDQYLPLAQQQQQDYQQGVNGQQVQQQYQDLLNQQMPVYNMRTEPTQQEPTISNPYEPSLAFQMNIPAQQHYNGQATQQQNSVQNYQNDQYVLNTSYPAGDITQQDLSNYLDSRKPVAQMTQQEAIEAYYKELKEIEKLEKQQANQRPDDYIETYEERMNNLPHQENCIYEHEQIPDMISVSVQYTNSLLYYHGNDNKYLFSNVVFSNKPNDNYYRLYNNQLLFTSTLQEPVRFEKIGGFNSATTIWYLTGQIIIENLANQTGFYQNIRKKFIDSNKSIEEQLYVIDDDIDHSIENLSYLCYNLQFITQDPEIANYRLNLKSDQPLIGVIPPGEKKVINITFAIIVADVQQQQIPDLPRIFQNFVYDGSKDRMNDLSDNVFLRLFAVRFDRMYSQEELEVLPQFKYDDQFDGEIRDVVDIPVVFQQNIIVNKMPHKEIRAGQEFMPRGDFRLDKENTAVNNIKYLQALNLQFLKFMMLLPQIQFDSVIDFGVVQLKRAKQPNRFVEELKRLEDIKTETKNFDSDSMMFSVTPGGARKTKGKGRSPKQLRGLATPKTAKTPTTAKANDLYFENDGNDDKQYVSYDLSAPLKFLYKNVDFKQSNLQKLLISLQPVNLPKLFGLEESPVALPVISDIFHIAFTDGSGQFVDSKNCIVIDTAHIFNNKSMDQGELQIVFQIPEILNEKVINALVNSGVSLPISVEQQFELQISTYQQKQDNCFTSFPILIQAKIDLHKSVAVNRVTSEPKKGIKVKNCILGTNLKTINGFTDQVFTDLVEFDLGVGYQNSKVQKYLQLYNGSDRTVVAFVEGCKKPFKANRTFKIEPYGQFLWPVEFIPLEPGNYSADVQISWPDVDELSKEAAKEKAATKQSTNYKCLKLRMVGVGIPVCLLLKQLDSTTYLNYNEQNVHNLRIPSGTNQVAVQVSNISMKPVMFSVKTDSAFAIVPAQGTVEPLSTGTVICRYLGGPKQGSLRVQAEFTEAGQRREQCIFDGTIRVI